MRILMLGNSLTTANNLPDTLADRLQADVVVHARGGARLSEHLNPNAKLGAKTLPALEAGGWDFIVLQEMSNGALRFRERYLAAVEALCTRIGAADATPVIYATWAYTPTCAKLGKLGVSHDEMFRRMDEAHREAARRTGALLANVGEAFERHEPLDALYAADGVHPSPAGTDVALACLARAIEKEVERTQPYTVYLLECEDGSYYAGITTDIDRRWHEHLSRGPKCARYTRSHPVKAIAATWTAQGRAEASRLEFHLKQLSHEQKCALAENPALLWQFLQ